MGEITELARELLYDDDFIQGFYRDDPDAVFEYLREHPYISDEEEVDLDGESNHKSFYNKTQADITCDLLVAVGLLEEDYELTKNQIECCSDVIYQRIHSLELDLLKCKLETEMDDSDKQFLIDAGICDKSDKEAHFVQAFYNMFVGEDTNRITAYAKYVLNEQIIDDLISCKRCEEGCTQSEYAAELAKLFLNQTETTLKKLHVRNPWCKLTSSSTPKDWLTQKHNGIKSRKTAIKLCFALGADYGTTKDFLNKCGFALLHPRNAEDATYIYCLINKRTYIDARIIINKYQKINTRNDLKSTNKKRTPPTEICYGSGTTHFLMSGLLGDSSWDSDDDFLRTFLIPKREMFTSYSKTALLEYYKLKNPLYFPYLEMCLESEEDEYIDYLERKKTGLGTKDIKSGVQVSYNFCKFLKDHQNDNNLIKRAYGMLNADAKKGADGKYHGVNNSVEVCNALHSESKKNENDLLIQKSISDMLTESITPYRFLSFELPGVAGKGEGYKIEDESKRQRRLLKRDDSSDNDFSNTVLKKFPHRPFFTKFEKNPDEFLDDFSVRNAIILLFFLKYSKDWSDTESEIDFNEESAFGLDPFLIALNGDPYDENDEGLLGKCGLGFIYPPNRFDWLICFCIRHFELMDPIDRAGEKPSEFFNSILKASFGDSDMND